MTTETKWRPINELTKDMLPVFLFNLDSKQVVLCATWEQRGGMIATHFTKTEIVYPSAPKKSFDDSDLARAEQLADAFELSHLYGKMGCRHFINQGIKYGRAEERKEFAKELLSTFNEYGELHGAVLTALRKAANPLGIAWPEKSDTRTVEVEMCEAAHHAIAGQHALKIADTHSMLPTLDKDCVVITAECRFSDLKRGDIVVFYPAHSKVSVIAHRLQTCEHGKWKTKGDNCQWNDYGFVTSSNYSGLILRSAVNIKTGVIKDLTK